MRESNPYYFDHVRHYFRDMFGQHGVQHISNPENDGKGAKVIGQHYLYPHNFPNHYVEQQYLPDSIADHVYYKFGDNKQEQLAWQYRLKILGKTDK